MRLKHTLLQYFLEETPVLFWLLQKSDYSEYYYWNISYYMSVINYKKHDYKKIRFYKQAKDFKRINLEKNIIVHRDVAVA